MPFKWYISGLNFKCVGCGRCCQGPDEGYIWTTENEIKLQAKCLGITIDEYKKKYTKKLFANRTIVEEPFNNDCIFLENRKSCKIYSVRPNQCRTWPFWDMNLVDPDTWNQAAQRCPGINRGKHYSFDEIEKIRKQKFWWRDKDNESGVD